MVVGDANDYYRYFLKRGERFVIRARKNRNVIYIGKTCNIMDVATQYKGAYYMDRKDKSGRAVYCKMSCIPVRLCEFPSKELVLTVVYGFGAEPMLLLSNLKMQEKKRLCHIIAKVYLLRWLIEEYFRFKKSAVWIGGFKSNVFTVHTQPEPAYGTDCGVYRCDHGSP